MRQLNVFECKCFWKRVNVILWVAFIDPQRVFLYFPQKWFELFCNVIIKIINLEMETIFLVNINIIT